MDKQLCGDACMFLHAVNRIDHASSFPDYEQFTQSLCQNTAIIRTLGSTVSDEKQLTQIPAKPPHHGFPYFR